MPKVCFLPIGNNSNSLREFKSELDKQHKNSLIVYLSNALIALEKYGFEINQKYKRDTLKKLDKELYEIRIKNMRLMMYFDGDNFFVILHGFIKKTQKTLQIEIKNAKKEIQRWKSMKNVNWLA